MAADAGDIDVQDEEVLRKMFIGGLNTSTSSESLATYFLQYGDVASTTVMKDANGRSAFHAFVICALIFISVF